MRRLHGIPESVDVWSTLKEMVKNRGPAVLQFTGSQRAEHDLVTKQQRLSQSPIPRVVGKPVTSARGNSLLSCSDTRVGSSGPSAPGRLQPFLLYLKEFWFLLL